MKTALLMIFAGGMNLLFSQEPVQPDSVQSILLKKEVPESEIMADPEEAPVFPGGSTALNQWLARTIVYPPEALEMGLSGKVYFKFTVETDGTISNIQVVRGVPDCPECDQEALRVMKLMPLWIPGKLKGEPVKSYIMMPVIFRLQ